MYKYVNSIINLPRDENQSTNRQAICLKYLTLQIESFSDGILECFKMDLNNGKDDKSIAGNGGDAKGVEEQGEPEAGEAGR